jgi:hypothetical protein
LKYYQAEAQVDHLVVTMTTELVVRAETTDQKHYKNQYTTLMMAMYTQYVLLHHQRVVVVVDVT